jgi:hypothetical protein
MYPRHIRRTIGIVNLNDHPNLLARHIPVLLEVDVYGRGALADAAVGGDLGSRLFGGGGQHFGFTHSDLDGVLELELRHGGLDGGGQVVDDAAFLPGGVVLRLQIEGTSNEAGQP